VRCNQDGSGTISWSATGIATGPYSGPFTETGRVSFGPPPNSTDFGQLTSVEVTFHIDSALGDVDGRKFLAETSLQGAICGEITTISGSLFTAGHVFDVVRYVAIIKPVTGGSFVDQGTSFLQVVTTIPGTGAVDTTFGLVSELFTSELAVTQPVLPDAKEQCKETGFLIFGVFKNQGDCVSFLSTYGKNEPGKNQPKP
jgi:hypothetical protein